MSWAEETRRVGLAGGEILSAHAYRSGISADVDYAWVEFFLCG
jgi:hypothetical protein